MADTPDTPETPAAEQRKPAPRRRGPARKPAAAKTPRGGGDTSLVARAEETVSGAATAARDAVTGTADKVVKAVKPRSTTRATPRPNTRAATSRASASGARTAAAEPAKRSGEPAKRSGATAKRATPAKRAAPKRDKRSTLERATEVVTGRIGAAIAGGVAAAALLTLRGSTARKPAAGSGASNAGSGARVADSKHAHQPDGTDSSQSFEAGIADENTVPEQA